jgi:2'-5' RNA ligase
MTRTVIASLPEARAAIEAARSSGVVAELESPPDAASIYGVLWFAELNRTLLAEFPDVTFTLMLDCGSRADLAHAALVEGIKRIRFSGHPEAAKALQDIAQQSGAELVASPTSILPRAGGGGQLSPPPTRGVRQGEAATPVGELLYVIAEPELSEADRDWIQSVRARHDPQFDLVGPHFTVVFGVDALPAAGLLAGVQEIARRTPPFVFELAKVELFPGAAADYYLFLMPAAGAQELTSLHEALRLGPAGDIAFVPHMTIGRFESVAEATTLAEELNAATRIIRGRVSALKIVAVAGQQVRGLATVPLKGN